MYEKLRARVLPRLIPPKAKVLVAVSGGPDSVALAHVLWRYAMDEKKRELELVLSHVNHGVRPESAEEEVLVRRLAEDWGLPCVIHRFDAKKYARSSRQSFQEGARAWRYERWEQDMKEYGCTHLATAHHLGDQAETVLYRLLRGSGTAGLAGILPSHNGVLRPLLTVTKEEILVYCAMAGLPYALDRSNEEPVYVRNKIRLQLLPQLAREYNPQIVQALGRTADLMRWDEEYLQGKADELWRDYLIQDTAAEIRLKIGVIEQPFALVSRVLRRAATKISGEPRGLGYDYIVRMMEQGLAARSQENFHWRQDLPRFQVEINPESICFKTKKYVYRPKKKEKELKPQIEVRLQEGTWVDIPELGIKVGIFTDDRQETALGGENVAVFDLHKFFGLSKPPVCRTRRPGDKMWLKGVGHKDLKKVFQEERIKAQRRSRLPLIAAGSEVLWIPGVKRSDLALPEQDSPRAYCVLKVSDEISL
ncbi:tRNA lysidine(34) synthetase TilS [Paradesulfitobacterium ferrireducens]|uniref:tRNA lysidine(34) synthetase TilS n=1 Tax=Paradesulfitobacterium ferrireducens TaxID=2816476 RepID=UPI001A8DC469|nr:tRNA lysidine(34) synthetase TilS [Paradesulfitobacterium ferrireducens]